MQGPNCGFAVFIWTCTPFTVMLLHQAGTDVWPPIRPSYPDQMHIMGAYAAWGMEHSFLHSATLCCRCLKGVVRGRPTHMYPARGFALPPGIGRVQYQAWTGSCSAEVPTAAAACREWIEAAMEAAQKEDSERRKALATQRKGAREELKKLEEQEVALLVAQ